MTSNHDLVLVPNFQESRFLLDNPLSQIAMNNLVLFLSTFIRRSFYIPFTGAVPYCWDGKSLHKSGFDSEFNLDSTYAQRNWAFSATRCFYFTCVLYYFGMISLKLEAV